MYESYSKQSLPTKIYRELLGSSLCVFNSNNSFIIENILNHDIDNKYDWYDLIGKPSGNLTEPIKKTITKKSNTKISTLFGDLVAKRNRIVHSFQTTDKSGQQILATKSRNGQQFIITEEYLYDFIKVNEQLSSLLHDFRGY